MARARKPKEIVQDEPEETLRDVFGTEIDEDGEDLEPEVNNIFQNRELTLDEIKALSADDSWDIFEDVGLSLVKGGDKVKFIIRKNGEHVGTLDYFPGISWEHIRKKYGGGVYHVLCRSTKLGQIVKTQSETLGGDAEVSEVLPQAQIKENPMDSLLVLQELQKQSRLESKETAERMRLEMAQKDQEAKTAQSNQFALMIEMIKSSKKEDNSPNMILELAKLQMQSADKINEAMSRMMENTNKRFEDMLKAISDSSKKKDDGPSALELMKMRDDAEAKGFSQAQMIHAMAEDKAEEIAERDAAPPAEKEDVTTTILKTMLPAFMQAQQQNQGVVSLPANARRMPPSPTPPPRRAVSSAGGGIRRGSIPTPGAAHEVQKPTAARGTVAPSGQVHSEDPKKLLVPTNLGLPSAKAINKPIQPTVLPKEKHMNGSQKLASKELIKTTVVEIIGLKLLANDLDPNSAAKESLSVLSKSGISANDLFSQFSLQDMMVIAAEQKMPPTINPYLEGFYAYIQARTTHDAGGSAKGSEPRATVQ